MIAILTRFPSSSKLASDLFLKSETVSFARYKQEIVVQKRNIFMAEHALILPVEGHKFLHIEDNSLKVESSLMIMVKRGIYGISEYVEEGLNYEAMMIFFTDQFVREFLIQYNFSISQVNDSPGYLIIPVDPLLESFRLQYLSYFQQSTAALGNIMQLKLQELFLLLLSSPQKLEILAFMQDIAATQVLDITYITKKHLLKPLTIDELAKLSGRSLASFKRDFREKYNTSPKKWINEQRLKHALTLVEHTHKQVAEIAMECGFESVSHFIRIYKQEFGQTPNAQRAKTATL